MSSSGISVPHILSGWETIDSGVCFVYLIHRQCYFSIDRNADSVPLEGRKDYQGGPSIGTTSP